MLSSQQLEKFIADGYIRIDRAFPKELADQGREVLWRDMGVRKSDPKTWKRPVVWLGGYHDAPFVSAANTPKLLSAYDQLVGPDCWVPMRGLGTFPVRFPTDTDTGDTGWHLDASFPGPDSAADDFSSWRVNVNSKGRALLALFLFSDVGELDAPTRIRVGSHALIARLLEASGRDGIAVRSLDFASTSACKEVAATGEAGTVYLCHPFLVHAAQINRGHAPRFMAQPPLFPKKELDVREEKSSPIYPVEAAIRAALERSGAAV
ncbi:phytanoyl-CoA dioxygenase family protein [Solimonas variicoloris]|uniref:phytanoyl-CoA dioxygenase family protein n=1 Tax=Solimonas variicoloris TaxID=254408 RepID=UPI000A02346D|nr:phytanoyl-CoA dioxygenase family protein [Solimonas variicoloris]